MWQKCTARTSLYPPPGKEFTSRISKYHLLQNCSAHLPTSQYWQMTQKQRCYQMRERERTLLLRWMKWVLCMAQEQTFLMPNELHFGIKLMQWSNHPLIWKCVCVLQAWGGREWKHTRKRYDMWMQNSVLPPICTWNVVKVPHHFAKQCRQSKSGCTHSQPTHLLQGLWLCVLILPILF